MRPSPLTLIATALVGLGLAACLELDIVRGEGAICDELTPCADGFFCDRQLTCQPLLLNGASCDGAEACVSGHCATGVCCASACLGTCTTCARSGSVGQCVEAEPGVDIRNDCPGTTSCGLGARCQATPLWSLGLSFVGDQRATRIAAGSNGQVLVAGSFSDQIVLGGTALQSGDQGNDRDGFVARIEGATEGDIGSGEVSALADFRGAGDQRVNALAVDPNDDETFVVGSFTGDAPGSLGAPAEGRDGFFASYDAAGQDRWLRRLGGAGDQQIVDVGFLDDAVFLLTALDGSVAPLDTCFSNPPAGPAVAVVELDRATGNCVATRTIVGPVALVPQAIAVADHGVYVALQRRDQFGDGSLQIQRFDPGQLSASMPLIVNFFPEMESNQGDDAITAMVAEPDGLWVAGSFRGDLFLTKPETSKGERDIFLAQLDLALAVRRAVVAGSRYDETVHDMAIDAAGRPVIVGTFEAEIDLGDGGIDASGGRDGFLAQLDGEGRAEWSVPFGGLQDDVLAGIAIDPEGNLLVAGSFGHDVTVFGRSPTLSSVDPQDAVVVKLTP